MAALVVVLYHYLLSFYPGIFKLQYVHTYNTIEQILSLSPLNILYNSSFAVCLFFVISGYALSHTFFVTHHNSYLASSAIRRYFRLEVPILFSVLLSYFLFQTGGFASLKTTSETTNSTFLSIHLLNIDSGFLSMLKAAMYSSVFSGGTINYNPVLWTMTIEFFGSLLVFAILALFGKVNRRCIIYALLIVFFHTNFIPAFIIGIALCDYYTSKERHPLSSFPVILLLLLSIFIGSYQSIDNSIWSILNPLSNINSTYPFIIGAALFLWVVINSALMQKLFSMRLMQFLGKISFSIYLIHLLLIGSLGSFLFNYFYSGLHLSYGISFIFMFLLSITFTIGASFAMYKYIDLSGIKLSKWVYTLLFEKK